VGPGPGSYKIPSEFGYYESKYAKAMEEEQIKKERQRTKGGNQSQGSLR